MYLVVEPFDKEMGYKVIELGGKKSGETYSIKIKNHKSVLSLLNKLLDICEENNYVCEAKIVDYYYDQHFGCFIETTHTK